MTAVSPSSREAYDAAIVGAGVMGCATALHLARSGMRCVLVDRGAVCGEASGVNAGTLTMHMTRAALIPYALKGWELWTTAAQWLDRDLVVQATDGLSLAFTEAEAQMLRTRAEARREAGAPIQIVDPARAREIEPGLSERVILAAHCPVDGFVGANLTGLAFRNALVRDGVEIRQDRPVDGIDRDGATFLLRGADEEIRARRVALAGGVWLEAMLAWFGLHLPIKCLINQLAITERMKPIMRTVVGVASGLLSLKQFDNGTVLIGGGWQGIGDPERGGAEIIPDNLIGNLRLARHAIPSLSGARVVRAWLGLEAETADAMPVIGPVPGVDDAFVIGSVHSGYTSGPFMGQLLAELILGKEPALPLFDPSRLVVAKP
jgi:glycine/D-amino acid oxidase-like deaminating enzyme